MLTPHHHFTFVKKRMLSQEITGDLQKRLKNIKGQLEGIIGMVEAGRDPDDISNQFKAADQALQKAHYLLLDEVFRKSLALKLVQVMNACPGNCPDAQKIELLQQQFPILQQGELGTKIKEIHEIGDRLAKYNEENMDHSSK